jgi:hypothetical protein
MKRLYTSYLAKNAKHPDAVAICAWVPRWFAGVKRYPLLAPEMSLVKLYKDGQLDQSEYTTEYFKTLKQRNVTAHQVVEDMQDGAIMLCFEKPGEFCHRRLVADWIETESGIAVPEWTPINTAWEF